MDMRRLAHIGLLLFSTLASFAAAEEYRPCAENKLFVGQCWDVRGRVSRYNGNPSVRIWPVGTNRLLGVRESDPPLLPPNLGSALSWLSWDSAIFADLKVCPLTGQREGTMQIVCISSVQNMVIGPR